MRKKIPTKKWIAAGTAAAMILSGAVAAAADPHSVAVDAGAEAQNEAVAQILSDILTARGYEVILTDDLKGEGAGAQAVIQLRTGGAAPVINMTVKNADDVDSLPLSESVASAYSSISLSEENEIPSAETVKTAAPTVMVQLDKLVNKTAPLNLDSDTDQAWAAYMIADGIDGYFAESGGEAEEAAEETEAPAEETTEAPVEETTEAPVEETTEAPVQETTEAPVEETTEAPAEETTEAPVEETTEAPAQETTEAPVKETTEAPAEETTEEDFDFSDGEDNDRAKEKDAANAVESEKADDGSISAEDTAAVEAKDGEDTPEPAPAEESKIAESVEDEEDEFSEGTAAGPATDEDHPEPAPQDDREEGALSPSSGSGSAAVDPEADLEAAQNQFKSAVSNAYGVLPQSNGHWAMYVCDLKNDLSGFAPPSANERMQAASLIKLYIMAAVYENFDSLSASYGQDALDGYLYPMITVSDNDAANALVGMLGGGDSQAGMNVVNDFCAAHGYTSTHMGRLLLASNEFDDNYTSVVDCGRFLREVYRSSKAEAGAADASASDIWTAPQVTSTLSHAGDMFNLLKAQALRNKIPAQMPDGVLVANKTGELGDVENDAGIIYDTANGSDLVIVFMSENLNAVGEAQNAIASASRVLYDAYH